MNHQSIQALIQSNLAKPNAEEVWVFWSIALTFVFYFLGALYLVAPVLGWSLLIRVLLQRTLMEPNTSLLNPHALIWVCSAFGLLLALVVGHVSYDLGMGKIIKSSIGWAKGWALLIVFILIGIYSNIRSEFIIRAACFVGLVALLLAPILILAWLLGLPGTLYVSPLKVVGGSGPEYFTVILYEIDPGNGSPRWRFFAPWAPAVGFVANIYLLCALYETNRFWRWVGILGNALMIGLAASRMGILVMLMVPVAVFFLSRLLRPGVLIMGVLATAIIAFNFEWLFNGINDAILQIKEARADSTRVRATLNEIAVYRWQSEAPWFGHGVVEPGSHLVEFMPIGTHHNWYGLLFVKGTVGFLSFLLPFLITGLALLVRSQVSRDAALGLGTFLVLGFFSFSENIEALAYLTWPAWLLIGIALRQPLSTLHWANLVMATPSSQLGEKRYV